MKSTLYILAASSRYVTAKYNMCPWYAVMQLQSLDALEFTNKTQKGFMDLKGD